MRCLTLKAYHVSILTNWDEILFLGLYRISSKTSKKKLKIMTKRNSWASGEAEYDDVAIPYADEPLGQATVFPIVQ